MENENTTFFDRRAHAIAFCREQIDWYERVKYTHRLTYQTFHTIVALLSVTAPLIILLSDSKKLQALAAASTGLVTNLDHLFQPKDHYVRFAHTQELLKLELFLYETRSGEKYRPDLTDDKEALDTFIYAITSLTKTETLTWRSRLQ